MPGNVTLEVKAYMEKQANKQLGGDWTYENHELTCGARKAILELIDKTKPFTIRNVKIKEI